jgi:hypothetical protein
MLLRKLIPEGFYTITEFAEHSSLGPYTVRRVGANLPYSAFHYQLKTIEHAQDSGHFNRERQSVNSVIRQPKPVSISCEKVTWVEQGLPGPDDKEQRTLVAQLTELQERFSSRSARLESVSAENRLMANRLVELNALLTQIQNSRIIRIRDFILKIPGVRQFRDLLR